MPKKRTFGVTLLLWMVLSLTAWGAVRFFSALRWWDVLSEFGSGLSPLYLSMTGAGWSVAGGVLLYGMWSGRRWTPSAILIAVPLWLIEYWVERIFFEAPRANLSFAVAISIFITAVAWVAANQKNTVLFFTRSEEHEQTDENPVSE